MFTSGYNNDDWPVGYLYVVDAYTGNLIQKIARRPARRADAGLAQINNYVNNVLRRQHDAARLRRRPARHDLALRFRRCRLGAAASAPPRTARNNAQPITIRPELAELNGKPMVFVGTGKLLGASDVEPTPAPAVGLRHHRSADDGRQRDLSGAAQLAEPAADDADRTPAPARRGPWPALTAGRATAPQAGWSTSPTPTACRRKRRAGQRRDEARPRHARRRQQRADERRLHGRRPQLVQLSQLQRRPGRERRRPEHPAIRRRRGSCRSTSPTRSSSASTSSSCRRLPARRIRASSPSCAPAMAAEYARDAAGLAAAVPGQAHQLARDRPAVIDVGSRPP